MDLGPYLAAIDEPPGRARRRKAEFDFLFGDDLLAGKSVLDIGAGSGKHSIYAAYAGASRVVALEPEVAGSTAGSTTRLTEAADMLGLDTRIRLVPATLQEYESEGEQFDIVLLNASINHLDEDACIRLPRDAEAQARYRRLFAKIAGLARPGATLLAVDVAPTNLFRTLRLKNPLVPTIEWEKHQPPNAWASLLSDVGFADPRVRWGVPNILGSAGQTLLGSRAGAYLFASVFRLRMTKTKAVEG